MSRKLEAELPLCSHVYFFANYIALFQVSQNGIDAMTYLVDRMAVDFRPYISTVLPPIIDRLGESIYVHLPLLNAVDYLNFSRYSRVTL
jgi:hypothetical protein